MPGMQDEVVKGNWWLLYPTETQDHLLCSIGDCHRLLQPKHCWPQTFVDSAYTDVLSPQNDGRKVVNVNQYSLNQWVS